MKYHCLSRLVDLQKSGDESQTSKARETGLGGSTSGDRGGNTGGRELRLGDGDAAGRDRDGGGRKGRDGGVVAGAVEWLATVAEMCGSYFETYQVRQMVLLVVMMGLVTVQGQSVMVMVVGSVTVMVLEP